MPKPVDMSLIGKAAEDPAELLDDSPPIGHEVAPAPAGDDDLGLRSLLEHPETFVHPWWRDQARRSSPSIGTARRPAPWRAA
jgi:hypothetical protein